MPSFPELPKTHRAVVLDSTQTPPSVREIPTPHPGPGSCVVRILAARVASYANSVYDGTRQYNFPTPLVIGSSAIGRIAAVGPDATSLKPGQLVFVDANIRGRDDPSAAILSGLTEGFSEGSRILMRHEWRDSTYAEYAKMPLESCYPLNEELLLGQATGGGLGYTIQDLAVLSRLLVPFGGLRDIDLKPGETLVVTPATGDFGQAAIKVALAMGARVIAMGRNIDALRQLSARENLVNVVQITGNAAVDSMALKSIASIDAFIDISPPAAAQSTHIKSCILALKRCGRGCLMGGIQDDMQIPHGAIMTNNLTLKGKFMYERDDVRLLIKMVEHGVLKLGAAGGYKPGGKFGLHEWKMAFDAAAHNLGTPAVTVIDPTI